MGAALYRLLTRLLPRPFRDEFGEEMALVVEDGRSALESGPLGRTWFWLRQYRAVIWLGVTERFGGRVDGQGTRRSARGGPGTDAGGGRDMGGTDGILGEGFAQDLRHGIRSLARRPGFTAVTALTLALGIGPSTVVFSALHTVLLRDLPYADVERIVTVRHVDTRTGELGEGMSVANAADLAESSDFLEYVGVAEPYSQDLTVDGRAESLRAWAVSEGFLEAVGASPVLGRGFASSEYLPDGEPVVLVGYRSWTNRFGSDPALVGRTLALDGADRTVVGVLPEWFRLPTEVELWLPRAAQPYDASSRRADYMLGLGRLTPGATLAQAQAETDGIARSFGERWPTTNADIGFRLTPLRDHLLGDVRAPLWVVMGAVALVFLIACANVAGLMLARGAERQREYALRGALGAGHGRLMRLVVVESGVVAVAGCVLGVVATFAGVAAVRRLGPDHLPRIDELGVDATVLLFAVGVAGLSALLAGLAPALRLSRPDLTDTLVQGARGTTAGRASFALRNRLVVAQIAVAMVLLVGAGLLGRSFLAILDQDLGFASENRLAVQVFAYDYATPAERVAFLDQARDNLLAIPGVRQVALTSNLPGSIDGMVNSIDTDLQYTVDDRPAPEPGQEPVAWYTQVSPDFFDLLEIPLLEGRAFEAGDGPDAPGVILVNETLARAEFGDDGAVGRTLRMGTRRVPRDIVGVVADVRPGGHLSRPRPEVYAPLAQAGTGSVTFVLHTDVPPGGLTRATTEAIWQANPAQAVWGAATLDAMLAERLAERRFNLALLGTFAVLALTLVAVGIYGLVSFSVEVRTAEMGIRRALGGPAGSIVRMVLGEGARLAALGVALGVLGSLVSTRFLRSMLFGVEPTDPGTFVALGALLLAVSAVAALVPALRATRADPVDALRAE